MLTKVLGRVDYLPMYQAMQAFTQARGAGTADELWVCEHPPTFTQGLAGKADHLLAPGDIPVLATNRGGQVTYHGPGQVVAYPLIDLKRAGYFVKEYVYRIEEAVIRTLWEYGVTPRNGQFDGLGKVAALGIKVSRHCTYHGVALNVAMDLEPFTRINPCGYAGLETVDLSKIGVSTSWNDAAALLAGKLQALLAP